MQYPLHPKWKGVWEIHGNSRWNGQRMVIVLSDSNDFILTDPVTMEEFLLKGQAEDTMRAHWDFRSSGKAQRYYIGTLLKSKDCNEIQWMELRRNRKTDKWVRIDLDPKQYLDKYKQKKPTTKSKYRAKHSNTNHNQQRRIQRPNDHSYDNNFNHNHSNEAARFPPYTQSPSSLHSAGQPKKRYVLKQAANDNDTNNKKSKNTNAQMPQINDPAILNIGSSYPNLMNSLRNDGNDGYNQHNKAQEIKYQTQHQPKVYNRHHVDYYPKPRKTNLRYAQKHEPRYASDRAIFGAKNKQYRVKGSSASDEYNNEDNKRNRKRKAAVVDEYLSKDRQRDQDNKQKKGKKEKKGKKKRRGQNRFASHLNKEEADKLLEETKSFKSPVIHIGEVSISRFNQNVCYVRIPGSDRDIRISGFVDRNRAFHGDQVVVSLYPEVEWMAAIKPEITAFRDVLDERDRLAAAALIEEEIDMNEEEEEDINEVILSELKKTPRDKQSGFPGSGSSEEAGDDDLDEEDDDDEEDEADDADDDFPANTNVLDNADDNQNSSNNKDEVQNDYNANVENVNAENEEDEEVIYFDDEDSAEKDDKEENARQEEVRHKMEKMNVSVVSAKKGRKAADTKNNPKEKTDEIMFKKARRRFEDLNDEDSITALDQYLLIKDFIEDFKKFTEYWPHIPLTDKHHPRRDYIKKVMKKCGGKLPSEALQSFEWADPASHGDKIPRGKIVGIYDGCMSNKQTIPGFLQPLVYNEYGQIDRKWAIFTPDDKRYPKANFPMRELPKSLRGLFEKFEKEEMQIIEEYECRKHDLRRQGYKYRDIDRMLKPRTNRYTEELKLIYFEMSFEEKWPTHYFYPVCHLKKELGRRGAIEVETKRILSLHKISWGQKFSAEIENFVKDFKIDPDRDYAGRRDCRSMRVFTIDPTSARDFDDALSIEEMKGETDENGNKLYKIGIHIADVTHFVKEGSVVDMEAKNRATSVYLVDRCLPMLPHHLCQNLCSLNPDVDRLAYSVFVILNEKGHLVTRCGDGKDPYSKSPWFGRTVIRSRARLNYETAHWMLTDKVTADTPLSKLDDCCLISDDTTLAEIIQDTKLFWMIAKQMRDRRFDNGSVQFFRPHLRFRLDKQDKHKALVFGPEILLWSNNLIEEMMLLANQLVAKQLVEKVQSHTLLRRHPSPSDEKGMKLKLICRSQNMELKLDSPKHLNESLIEMQSQMYDGVNAAQIINPLIAQAMMRAEYIILDDSPDSEWSHWALNFPIYTHFTSPIRRYADVIVHRLLTYTLSEEQRQNNQPEKLELESLALPSISAMKYQCKICNERNAEAHFAEIDSQKIHLCLLLINRPIIVDAMLIDLYTSFFVLVIPGLGLDVRVNAADCKHESKGAIKSIAKQYELPDSRLVVTWRSGDEEEFKLFDKIRIRLSSVLKHPIALVTSIIEPGKRKYLKPANTDAVNPLMPEEEEKEDKHAAEEKINKSANAVNDENQQKEKARKRRGEEEDVSNVPPLAMTLDKQLSVGTSDYFDAHYD